MIVLDEATVLSCDFCNKKDPYPSWRLPTSSYLYGLELDSIEYGSKGDWLACDACLKLVETRNVAALVRQAGKLYFDQAPKFLRSSMEERYTWLYNTFFRNWSGNVVPGDVRHPGDGQVTLESAPEDNKNL